MQLIKKVLLPFAYYSGWLWFGLGGVVLNIVCAVLLIAPGRERIGRGVRGTIRMLFIYWRKWCHATHAFRVTWHGFDNARLQSGTVYVANHPSLVDAPVVLSRLPDAICIFKPALLHNPVIGPAAIMAGYASGGDGLDAIRDAAQKVSAGRSLLIFPEGTRTAPGERLGQLKPGFALIAQRAGAPIQILHIRVSRHLTTRGRAWWRLPVLPSWMEVTLGEKIPADTPMSCHEVTAYVEKQLAQFAEMVAPLV